MSCNLHEYSRSHSAVHFKMAVAWRYFQRKHFLNPEICWLNIAKNRFFRISSFNTTSCAEEEKDLRAVDDNRGNNFSENHNMNRTSTIDKKIPPPGNASLYEYVKTLEGTVAHGKGTILKSWSRLTKQPRNKNLNVSGSLKSGSLNCLGLTTQLLEQRLNFLQQIGIKGKDALIISMEFPAILTWDSPNFSKILKILTDLNSDIIRLMCKTPFVFGLDCARVTENIRKLSAAGVTGDIIGKLVTLHPIILTFPLRDESLNILRLLLDYHENVQSVDDSFELGMSVEDAVFNLLLQPLEISQEQVDFQDRFKLVVSFLVELQVSPLIIAAKNPMIFHSDIDILHNAIDFFTSKPLLLEMEVIQQLLISRPDIFVSFDNEAMRIRVQSLYGILQTPTALYNLILVHSSFVFEKSNTKLEDVIQWFRDIGVHDKEMRDLVTLKNFFSLEKRELTETVNYLLSVEGVTMETIRKHPACLLKPLLHLKARVAFIDAEKPDALSSKDLGQIMLTKNKEFAHEICGSSLEHFEQFLQSLNKDKYAALKSDE